MEPTGFFETSVTNCHPTLRNDPEERRSHLLRSGSLRSKKETSQDRQQRVGNVAKLPPNQMPLQSVIADFVNFTCHAEKNDKVKAISEQVWADPERSGKLKLPDFMTINTWWW